VPLHGDSRVTETPIHLVAFAGRPSAGCFASRAGWDFELKMRWCAHVLGRLAIAATCTNSTAGLEAPVNRGEYPFSAYSLWEHIMSNSPQSANIVAIRYSGEDREPGLAAPEKTCAARGNPAQALQFGPGKTVSSPSIMLVVTRTDHEDEALWSSMFASFVRAFALHGASYCNLLHAIATSPVESCSVQTEAERLAVRERRRPLAVGSTSTSPKLTEIALEQEANRSQARSEAAVLAEFDGSPPFADRPNPRHWLTGPCSTVASRWMQWRRERQIKKAVTALLALDDRTLQDIGIPHRSEIERVVRYCFDC
jgi:uncharacterized protein YjiS (DUF1127 family)